MNQLKDEVCGAVFNFFSAALLRFCYVSQINCNIFVTLAFLVKHIKFDILRIEASYLITCKNRYISVIDYQI